MNSGGVAESPGRCVGQVLQDGFDFELDTSVNHCICRWAHYGTDYAFDLDHIGLSILTSLTLSRTHKHIGGNK
jgi:hypothetical protein